jgi:KaiC/GvpD/RAD55 family RecA-like ATPase
MSAASPTFELLPTGVPNLDPVLGGGLRRGALAILMGPPGSGKTILAGQIGFAAARQGHRVLILTALSEPTTKIVEHWRTFRFFDPELVGGAVQIVSARQFLDTGLDAAAEAIIANARELRAEFVVLDGFSGLRGAGRDAQEARRFLYDIATTLGFQGATLVMTSVGEARDATYFADLTVADVIIGLHHNLVAPWLGGAWKWSRCAPRRHGRGCTPWRCPTRARLCTRAWRRGWVKQFATPWPTATDLSPPRRRRTRRGRARLVRHPLCA